jgi:hypothetical protein
MSENEWLQTCEFTLILEHLRGEPCDDVDEPDDLVSQFGALGNELKATFAHSAPAFSDRKWRLLNCACCRTLWPLLGKARCQDLVEKSEMYADRQLTTAKQREAASLAETLYHSRLDDFTRRIIGAAWGTLDENASESAFEVIQTVAEVLENQPDPTSRLVDPSSFKARVCDWIRDIFGNPWHRWRAPIPWLSSTVGSLAHAIYEERVFSNMPILADALEDAGCDNAEILGHCRESKEHVRGCWVVDLILGKE